MTALPLARCAAARNGTGMIGTPEGCQTPGCQWSGAVRALICGVPAGLLCRGCARVWRQAWDAASTMGARS